MGKRKIIKEFGRKYCKYYPSIFNYLYSKIKNRDDAEDICQEVFIRFYTNFDNINSHLPWLYSAVKFEILNFYRNKNNHSNEIEIDIDELENDADLSFENGFRDSRIVIKEAINDISNFQDDIEKNLFDLIIIYEYTFKEAAVYLGLTISQAEYKYSKIEKRILNYLNNKGIKRIEDLA